MSDRAAEVVVAKGGEKDGEAAAEVAEVGVGVAEEAALGKTKRKATKRLAKLLKLQLMLKTTRNRQRGRNPR